MNNDLISLETLSGPFHRNTKRRESISNITDMTFLFLATASFSAAKRWLRRQWQTERQREVNFCANWVSTDASLIHEAGCLHLFTRKQRTFDVQWHFFLISQVTWEERRRTRGRWSDTSSPFKGYQSNMFSQSFNSQLSVFFSYSTTNRLAVAVFMCVSQPLQFIWARASANDTQVQREVLKRVRRKY